MRRDESWLEVDLERVCFVMFGCINKQRARIIAYGTCNSFNITWNITTYKSPQNKQINNTHEES